MKRLVIILSFVAATVLLSLLLLQPAPQEEPAVKQELYQYVIYDHPKDHPHFFVVRKWIITPGQARPGPLVGLRDTLEQARELVHEQQPGLVVLPRFDNDDPVIVEVWM